ncbi:hypothetical protein MRB53_020250 [Persea americana]|uniref:Uncharacterized protein n=1 Tax=Persea americana TaxID=3435 RepID=A0ACC2L0Q6_PERAE|nr:hypothetical protein MRB53_020250 [Persea americana]
MHFSFILQWLFKMLFPEQTIEITTASKRMLTIEEGEEASWDDELKFEKGGVARKDSIAILLTRANSRTCFYSTLNFKKNLRSIYERKDRLRSSVKEDLMVHKDEPAQLGGEIQPICEETSSDSSGADYNSDTSINKKRRAISRMKELLRWTPTAKSEKGGNKRWKVLYFRNRGTTKGTRDDTSTESSKISFSWDVGSCSTASSSFSPLSLASSSASHLTLSKRHLECITREICDSPKTEECMRTGNWITNDSEFVVLEL